MILHFALLFALMQVVIGQLPSPCPDIFHYDAANSTTEFKRWYGNIILSSEEDVTGIYIHIILDRPANLLGNWFSQVTSCDNTLFVVRNLDYTLAAGHRFKLPFFVNYDPSKPIPSVETIKFNGNVICTSLKTKRSNSVEPIYNSIATEITKPKTEVYTTLRSTQNTFDTSWLITESSSSDIPQSFLRQDGSMSKSCGVVASRVAPLISNGQETFPGQWPWHAALYHFDNIQINYECGGTLITEQHILTAAHCVTILRTKKVKDPSDLLISLGKYNLKRFDRDLQNKGVIKIIPHPEYDPSWFYNDIAILKLSSPVDITNYVRPVCLWDDKSTNMIGQAGTVVGWGLNENNVNPHILMQAKMPIASHNDCLDDLRYFLHKNNFCAGYRNGTTVCQGDSGGGMVFPKKNAQGLDVWYIRGIVSLGLKTNLESCEKYHHKLFTDVAKYTRWIKEVIKE